MTLNNKRVVACIIVRMKSARLKQKALIDLCGYPMTEQLIRRLRLSKTITDIVICTSRNKEDAILLTKATEWGVKAYAGHEDDVLSRLVEVSDIYNADMVLRVTGDNPFTDAENIDRMVERHIQTGAEYTRTNRLPLGVTAEVMGRDMLKKLHSLMPDPCQSEYMSFFSFNPDIFHCEVLEPLPQQDRPYYSLTIDYPEDLALATMLYSKISPDGGIPSLDDVIHVLDNDPEYKSVDKNKSIKLPNDQSMTYEELIVMLDKLGEKARQRCACV